MTAYKWQFSPRFRRNAFGWKSQPAIQRIKEAVSEIKQVARKEPVLAAEGAVLFLEKLSPAIEHVDSSSGAIGGAVNRAIETLVPIIAEAGVDQTSRQKWLERLWEAVEEDAIPYLESLGEYWGELCARPEIASQWADEFMPTVLSIWSPSASGHRYFKGTTACLSALYSAGRYEELLSLLEKARFKWWNDRRWGVKALVAMGRNADAIRYAEDSAGLNTPRTAIALACEQILLNSGFADEAYGRYAIEANQGTTNLARFRAIVKKYPNKPAETILRDLVASQPGQEGKWFAAAKDAGLFELAIELANQSPTDPRTLIRAARDYAVDRPPFAMAVGMTGLRYIAQGYGYEITSGDVLDAYAAVMHAAAAGGMQEATVKESICALLANGAPSQFVMKVLARHLLA
jgi:tetratricopeptide (TPR) repeat protein